MSHFYSNPISNHFAFVEGDSLSRALGEDAAADPVTDRAINDALRNVPLPAGLMTRLGMLVYNVSDETADQVDYLGC